MRDFVVDISDPVFYFVVKDFVPVDTVDEPAQILMAESGVAPVSNVDEILLLRAAAQEAMNDSR